ncbi:hypothetical protein EAH88_11765 [Rhodanobacter glycinis]|uniref:Uncharacterized protein n=1 Tax=Rhodanobacter glycinis TaxID=582702 RepID=A0A502C668_9GAMM|nr:hypothetical protein [Rhodanobacter glycinis]TPG08303.1 hypothetical protein EAH88_11765 [Rhodanobacter glycinis]
MNTQIIDHGELDYLTPAPTETDKAIADAARHAMAEQRYYLNTQERLRQERVKSRALYEQGERDFHVNKTDGQA